MKNPPLMGIPRVFFGHQSVTFDISLAFQLIKKSNLTKKLTFKLTSYIGSLGDPGSTLTLKSMLSEWREMTEQTDCLAKQPSQVARFSEDLKCWGAWNTTCGHKARRITPSIAWRREAWKEEALDDLPWQDERGPSSVRRILEPFQRQRWGKTSEKRGGAHTGFSERIDTTLNWTELLSRLYVYIIMFTDR